MSLMEAKDPSLSTARHCVSALVFYEDMQEAPYGVKIPCGIFSENDQPLVTLAMLRDHLPKKGNFYYFFHRQCPITKDTFNWQVTEDAQDLPLVDGRIIVLLKKKKQSDSPGYLRYNSIENPKARSALSHAFDLPSENPPRPRPRLPPPPPPPGSANRKKPEFTDDRFQEFAGVVMKDDIFKMRKLAAETQGIIKCYTPDAQTHPEDNTTGLEQMHSTVDDAEAAQAFKTIKTWLLRKNMKGEARVHLAYLENICFPDGFKF